MADRGGRASTTQEDLLQRVIDYLAEHGEDAEAEATILIAAVVGLQLDLITTGDVDRARAAPFTGTSGNGPVVPETSEVRMYTREPVLSRPLRGNARIDDTP